MDKEEIIRRLKKISGHAVHVVGETPFIMGLDDGIALDEAVRLLKEQEAIPCGEKIKAGDVLLDFYECWYCKNAIRKPWRYCPFCGKAVKWDES